MFRPNAYKFCVLQTTCRPYAYKFWCAVQNICRPDNSNSVLCRLFADSMHTLRRTNQCQSKCRRGSTCGGGPLAAAGAHRGRQAPASCAKPHRFARDGETAAREGEAAAREGHAAAREGEAGGGAAREGEAVRLSALEVLLPAATAAPRASGIQSLSAPRPPPRLMMRTGRAELGIGRDRREQGDVQHRGRPGRRGKSRVGWAPFCVRAL